MPASGAHAAPIAPCTGDNLVARVTGTDAGMSQRVVYITVTNRRKKPCYVKGYPFLARMLTKAGPATFRQVKGATSLTEDAPAQRIVLKRRQKASFALAAAVAFDTKPVTFVRARIAPHPGVTPLSIDLRLEADRPDGQRYTFTTTAYRPGVGRAS